MIFRLDQLHVHLNGITSLFVAANLTQINGLDKSEKNRSERDTACYVEKM